MLVTIEYCICVHLKVPQKYNHPIGTIRLSAVARAFSLSESERERIEERTTTTIRRTVYIHVNRTDQKAHIVRIAIFSSQYSIVHRAVNTRVTIESTHAVIFALFHVFSSQQQQQHSAKIKYAQTRFFFRLYHFYIRYNSVYSRASTFVQYFSSISLGFSLSFSIFWHITQSCIK